MRGVRLSHAGFRVCGMNLRIKDHRDDRFLIGYWVNMLGVWLGESVLKSFGSAANWAFFEVPGCLGLVCRSLCG